MKLDKRNARRSSIARRRESNEEVRARFEKEAHDRERVEIQSTVDGYEQWLKESQIRRLM